MNTILNGTEETVLNRFEKVVQNRTDKTRTRGTSHVVMCCT
jgi:hypothetical protein